MINVIIPMAVLLTIILGKKIPVIGGKINIALLITGALTLILAGQINLGEWAAAWVDGLNRLSWIIALSITGSLFAEISTRLGTVDTIISTLTAKFGKHPRILIICILFALVLAGSLLGDAIAAATVIGLLTIGILSSMNMSYERICAIIVMGACVGSIMPPMTQALALSSSLTGANPDEVIKLGYITVSIVFLIVALYCSIFLVNKDNVPGANKDIEIKFADRKASEILKENWKSLIPMTALIIIVLLRTLDIPYISVDIGPEILKQFKFITLPDGTVMNFYDWLSGITVLGGFSNGIVLSIICAIAISFFFPVIRINAKDIARQGFEKVSNTVTLQICCAFMLGSFYSSGAIETVSVFAQGLDGNVLKIGGVVAMILLGMLTGSQSTTQNVVFSFFGPALVSVGMDPVIAALAGANLANAGQGMPPADLTTFVVVGIVSAQFGKKVDPLKSMIYSLPMCLAFLAVGLVCLYI